MKSLLRVGLAVVAGAVLAAAGARAAENAPVTIPVILPLTGPAAFVGASEQQSFQIFEKQVDQTGGIRNRPLRFSFMDDQGNPQVAVQLFQSAVASGAQVIFGGAFSATCKASAPLAEQSSGVVFYCLSTAIRPPAGSYVFTAYYHPNDVLEKMLAYFRSRGLSRVAILLGTDATGQEVDANLKTMLAQPDLKGVQVVALDHYDPAAVSISAQMAKIAAARPQALAVWAAGGIQTVFRAVHDGALDIPVTISPAFMVYSEMKQWADILPKHLYFAAGTWAAYAEKGSGPGAVGRFYQAYKQSGVAPDMGSDLGWDPALIVVEALRKVGPDAKAAQIHDYIEGLRGFSGTNGSYDFRTRDQRGISLSNMIVTEWSPAKSTWVLAPGS